jgi:Cu-Zn family superoxide dismutase
VKGVVTFTKVEGGVKIVADVEGLTPGDHGFHIHEFGDCSSADGTSAGGHFNPHGNPHGGPTAEKRHAGDLGNLTADDAGKAHLEWVDPHMVLEGHGSILGRSVIVHAKADDLTTQPTGNAGARVACGVIGVAKP